MDKDTFGAATIRLAQQPEADELLGRSPLAALVGMLLDQQVPMEWAFSGPYTIARRLGSDDLDAHAIAAHDPEAFAALLSEKPAVHRYPGSMAKRIQQLCAYLVEHYEGDAAAVWADAATGAELLGRLKELPGFGEQKAQIFLALLGKRFGVRPKGWREAAERVRPGERLPVGGRHHRTRIPGEGAGPQTGGEGGGQGGQGPVREPELTVRHRRGRTAGNLRGLSDPRPRILIMTENLTRATTAESISDGPGSLITLLTDTAELTCNTASFEVGAAGAPVHFHTKATEFFHVTDGRLDVLVGDEIHTLTKGDFLAVPPGVKHAFAPAADSTAEVFVGFTPGMGRFDYYRLLGRVRAARPRCRTSSTASRSTTTTTRRATPGQIA